MEKFIVMYVFYWGCKLYFEIGYDWDSLSQSYLRLSWNHDMTSMTFKRPLSTRCTCCHYPFNTIIGFFDCPWSILRLLWWIFTMLVMTIKSYEDSILITHLCHNIPFGFSYYQRIRITIFLAYVKFLDACILLQLDLALFSLKEFSSNYWNNYGLLALSVITLTENFSLCLWFFVSLSL